ncbi:MAG: B12-binding domain-containing radical SAM protein [Planctomycetota bacterium]
MKRALLLHPEFSPFGFWNYRDVCRLLGAKYPASPLGLITMAALLPKDWEIRLVDLNTETLDNHQIDWADLVFIGGMLSQQAQFLRLIDRVHARARKVVAGGPDPTSQPHAYQTADYLVLGEAESSLPRFLDDMERGAPSGIYPPGDRPALNMSPVPRFDLLNLTNYVMIGIQFSRGCPFNCEFCDIIELYGRRPRTKRPDQVVAELDALWRLGHRGHVDFVDDNFIGHKAKAKEMLRAVRDWSRQHHHPFYFSTEASLNLADDDELLRLMVDLDFRYVFVGIESPDEPVLASARKHTNLNRDIVADLHKIYRHGIVVNGGFILGFDHETDASARHMIDLIERAKICMAMVGLLYALPNTQLRRRLKQEERLLSNEGEEVLHSAADVDQVSSGINFMTVRPRAAVINDFVTIIRAVYSPRSYFDRCLRLSQTLKRRGKFRPSWKRMVRYARGFLTTVLKLGLRPATARYYWRNLGIILLTRPSSVETLVNLMAMYLHFRKQSAFIVGLMQAKLRELSDAGKTTPRARTRATAPPRVLRESSDSRAEH